MTSEKQTIANVRNSKKSTGPKSDNGKKIVSLNAVKHGLLSGRTLLPDENNKMFERFASNLYKSLLPIGELEILFVERIVSCAWRLRRVLKVELGLFEIGINNFLREHDGLGEPFEGYQGGRASTFSKLSRYETAIERSLYKALHELQRIQATRNGESTPMPAALDVTIDQDVL